MYEFFKDFSSPIAAIIIAICTVLYAFAQIRQQHDNTLKAQKAEANRKAKIDIFKELNQSIIQYELPISETETFCYVKKYDSKDYKAEITYEEYSKIMETFGNSVISLILKIEATEIINQKLFKAFRYALSVRHQGKLGF